MSAGTGWRIVGALSVTETVSWGVLYYAFAVFLESWEKGAPRWGVLFVAAFALGLAALSKYSAVFVALAVALHIALAPRRWPLLRAWQLYAAALLTMAMLLPVLIWNLIHWRANELPGLRRANLRLGEAVGIKLPADVDTVTVAVPTR